LNYDIHFQSENNISLQRLSTERKDCIGGVSAGFWSSAGAGVEVEVPDELSDTGGAHADKATTIMATAIRSARNFVFSLLDPLSLIFGFLMN